MSPRKPGRFGVRGDISGGPAICLYQQPLDHSGWIPDPIYGSRITWLGAYFAAGWRNLLGPLYVPL